MEAFIAQCLPWMPFQVTAFMVQLPWLGSYYRPICDTLLICVFLRITPSIPTYAWPLSELYCTGFFPRGAIFCGLWKVVLGIIRMISVRNNRAERCWELIFERCVPLKGESSLRLMGVAADDSTATETWWWTCPCRIFLHACQIYLYLWTSQLHDLTIHVSEWLKVKINLNLLKIDV